MTYASVASETVRGMLATFVTYRLHQLLVTVDALVLHNLAIKRRDLNWFMSGVKSECQRMINTINALDSILLNYVMRSMAICARRYCFVA